MKRLHLLEQQKLGFLRRHRLQQAFGADDFHHPFQVVGEHIQAHLRTHPVKFSSQKVRCPHPLLERPEGMLNSLFSNLHHLWRAVNRPCISSSTASCFQRLTRRFVLGVHWIFSVQLWHFELQ